MIGVEGKRDLKPDRNGKRTPPLRPRHGTEGHNRLSGVETRLTCLGPDRSGRGLGEHNIGKQAASLNERRAACALLQERSGGTTTNGRHVLSRKGAGRALSAMGWPQRRRPGRQCRSWPRTSRPGRPNRQQGIVLPGTRPGPREPCCRCHKSWHPKRHQQAHLR